MFRLLGREKDETGKQQVSHPKRSEVKEVWHQGGDTGEGETSVQGDSHSDFVDVTRVEELDWVQRRGLPKKPMSFLGTEAQVFSSPKALNVLGEGNTEFFGDLTWLQQEQAAGRFMPTALTNQDGKTKESLTDLLEQSKEEGQRLSRVKKKAQFCTLL